MSETVLISRPSYSQAQFEKKFQPTEKDKTIPTKLRKWKSSLDCSKESVSKFLLKKLPVFSWLPKYKKSYVVGDCVAAATVGVIRVPQGMAYALLAGVPPVYGLYSCFFPVILWFIFSTSNHTSVGTNAVICLMLQNLAAKYALPPDFSNIATTQPGGVPVVADGRPVPVQELPAQFLIEAEDGALMLNMSEPNIQGLKDHYQGEFVDKKVQIVLSASLVVGFIQLIMAVCRLGFLTTLMPDPVIQGFTTGAAFHVTLSQVKYLFGLAKYVPRHSGMFELFYTLADIIRNMGKTNWTDLVISVVCLPTMLLFKHFNQKYKKQLRNIPIPIELVLIIILTLVSYFAHFDKEPFNVNIVKYIPTGFLEPAMPQYLSLFGEMLSDCIIMALISVAVSLSLTKIYADKNGYDTDANQEIFALGICNTVSTFVGSFAVAASLSRTAIQESAGGHTQLVSVISSSIMLVVLVWLAPFFQPVPKSVLACIIIVALKSFFIQFSLLPALWRICKSDFVIWVVTCLAVVFFGVDYGLFGGIIFSVAVLLYRLQHPKHGLLGRITNTDLYAHMRRYPDAVEVSNIKIFQFSDSVSYTNKDAFRNKLYNAVGFNPSKMLETAEKYSTTSSSVADSEEKVELTTLVIGNDDDQNTVRKRNVPKENDLEGKHQLGFSYLILDATMWSFVDTTAAREIVQVASRFAKLDVTVMLAGVSGPVLKVLERMGMFEAGGDGVKRDHVFVTLHDSVITAERLVNGGFKLASGGGGGSDSIELRPGYPGFDALLL